MFLSVSYSAVSILYDRSVCKLYLGILGVDGKQGLHFQHKLLQYMDTQPFTKWFGKFNWIEMDSVVFFGLLITSNRPRLLPEHSEQQSRSIDLTVYSRLHGKMRHLECIKRGQLLVLFVSMCVREREKQKNQWGRRIERDGSRW